MSRFEVLGAPDPGLPHAYRGTSRDVPLVDERHGLNHPANRVLLQLLDAGGEEPIRDLPTAERLRTASTVPELGSFFEVVELTGHSERPQSESRLLGFDVAFEDGLHSLLAAVLLLDVPGDDAGERRIDLRRRFRDRLNDNLLFATEEDALEFLASAEAVGPWEGPDIEWAVVGLWLVGEDRQG